MSLLDVGVAKELIATDLSDDSLQLYIDDAESEIEKQIGAVDSESEDFTLHEGVDTILLSRKATSITTVTEDDDTLESDDYELKHNGRILKRLDDGTNPADSWGTDITVAYVPDDDTDRRKIVTVDLVKLALAYAGVKSERIGDYSMTQDEYEKQRNEIINRLRVLNV